jgi:hypothetical protein
MVRPKANRESIKNVQGNGAGVVEVESVGTPYVRGDIEIADGKRIGGFVDCVRVDRHGYTVGVGD